MGEWASRPTTCPSECKSRTEGKAASDQHHEQNARQIGLFVPFRLSDLHRMVCAQIASSEETT